MAEGVLQVVSYPHSVRYAQAWISPEGERRERYVDAVSELGRPTMAAIMTRLGRERSLREVPAASLGGSGEGLQGAVLDTPAGMLPCHRYRQHRVMMINNSGSLARCQLEELVYRAGIHWLWHSRCDDALFRRFFAAPFHSRSRRVTWFAEPPACDTQAGPGLPDGPLLVYCGRLDPEKRVDLLLHLLARLGDPQVKLVLVGAFEPTAEGAAYREHLQLLAQELGVARRLHWLGYLRGAALAAVVRRADLLVNLTVNHDETFGLAQAEALMLGTPVLGACWGGLKDVVAPGCGHLADTLVSDAGTFVDLHAALAFVRRFLADAALRLEMARAAREHGARFAWSTFVRELDERLAAASEPLPELDPDGTVEALVHEVLSPELFERIAPYLNGRAMQQKLTAIHALRNGAVLGKDEWMRFAIVDPLRHDDFVRDHYQFLYEPYGSIGAEAAARRLAGASSLFALRASVDWCGDAVEVVDAVFGTQRFVLSPAAARVLRACTAQPGLRIAELAEDGPDDTRAIVAATKELLGHGLAWSH
jgi:glycosyltransferase involved in cell wall biosynthesis